MMHSSVWRKWLLLAAPLAGLALLLLALRPSPLPVETGRATIGPLQVSLQAQGETRSHDRYVITAPVHGRLIRIDLHEGDHVRQGQTLAQLAPSPLGEREKIEQQARIAAAEALEQAAEQQLQHAAAEQQQAERELVRNQKLAQQGFVSAQNLERLKTQATLAAKAVETARYQVRATAADARGARAALLPLPGGRLLDINAPASGHILQINDKSERVVTAGTPLLTLGNLGQLEIVIDMLSTDAVGVKPGMPVTLDGWGGTTPLRARVRVVEPAAFTKISALGVEEKRTHVIADFIEPPAGLGDGFRVNARVVTWQADKVLKVPTSALFRCDGQWCVFSVEQQRARLRHVTPGQRTPLESQITRGLKTGDTIIIYPGNELQDGMRIARN